MEINIENRTTDVRLISKEGNKISFSIDGILHNVDFVASENGKISIIHDNNSFNVNVIRNKYGKKYDIHILNRSYHVDIIDTHTKYLQLKQDICEQQPKHLIAPMPGKIVSIPIQKGDKLKADDIVFILEAMKMQSSYKVNSACLVKEIFVTEGDIVDTNQILIELESI